MKKGIIFLSLTLMNIQLNALAPHPIYFSEDGRDSETEVEVEGKKYVVEWKGNKLDMHEKPAMSLRALFYGSLFSAWGWGLVISPFYSLKLFTQILIGGLFIFIILNEYQNRKNR